MINKVFLLGNLTRDPEVKLLGGDRATASFGLAVNRKWKGADGEAKEEVTFVDCECWGRTAETVGQFLTKGSKCLIEGRLKLDSWEDKTTGEKRSKLKVVAEQVKFLDAPGRSERTETATGRDVDRPSAQATSRGAAPLDDDDSSPPF